jgi:hypothetical protein
VCKKIQKFTINNSGNNNTVFNQYIITSFYKIQLNISSKKIFYKSNKSDKLDKINYIKISKIVFISSIVGGIGIIFGIKLGAILFL